MDLNTKTEKNYGIALLRVLLSFMVVMDHFYNYERKVKFIHILYYHIPTFFVISFYYNNKTLLSFDIKKIKLRFKRLIFPYFCWNTISLLLNNIYYYLFKRKCAHTLFDFLIGLLSGRIFIVSLWYQNILTFITLIMTIIIFLFKNDYFLIFQILMIISYRFQYSGENYSFFTNNYKNIYSYTYGRIIDIFPEAVTGFFISSFTFKNKIYYNKIRTILISIFILFILSKYNFDESLKNFRYGGLRLNLAAVCLFLSFLLSFDKLKNSQIIKIIDLFSNYTAGIYFTHLVIGKSISVQLLLGKNINTIFGCFIIYIISYVFCVLIDKIITNATFKNLIK